MLLRAFAKINLDLRILGKRSDGYHELRTVLQTIDLHDLIRIEPSSHFEFHAPPGLVGENNLIVRAVRAYEQAVGVRGFRDFRVEARITLEKRVPVGAGLGGGSSDAATTILGLEHFTGRRLGGPALFRCLRSLGSDIPFFAVGGRAVGIGRGEEVYPLEEDADAVNDALLLVVPEFSVSTAAAYSWLTVPDSSNSIEGFCGQFAPGRDAGQQLNDFEGPVFARHPSLAAIKTELLERGAVRAALSGSGAVVFGVFPSVEVALQASRQMSGGVTVIPSRPLSRAEYWKRMIAAEGAAAEGAAIEDG